MPTVLRVGSYRFYFYSHEPNEPPHVHIDRGTSSMKAWLSPVALTRNHGFAAMRSMAYWNMYKRTGTRCWRHGMNISARIRDERVSGVRCTDDDLIVDLMDGRTISVPLAWYPRLASATREQRADWQISGGGYGIHWPQIDEDLSTEGLLRGAPAAKLS